MEKIDLLSKIIAERRSVFTTQFSEEPVPDEWIQKMLENANWAPNHKQTEPWRFHIFSGSSLLKLSEYMGETYKKFTSIEKFSERKHQKRINSPLKSSHVIAICMQRDPKKRVPKWEELAAVSCAVMNLWLSCSALGLGGYWSTPMAALKADDFLKLPKNQRCLGLFYVGRVKAGLELTSSRTPVSEKVVWH
jgi:nitroreductase